MKILDFGLARFAAYDPLGATAEYLTQAGQVMGTVGYMSPEQATGHIPDGRGDIFSLGCVLYEMATGSRAFPGNNAALVLAAVLRDQPDDMEASGTTIPVELQHLVSRCLAKKPDDRFQKVHDVAIALRKLAAGEAFTPAVAKGAADPAVRGCSAFAEFLGEQRRNRLHRRRHDRGSHCRIGEEPRPARRVADDGHAVQGKPRPDP